MLKDAQTQKRGNLPLIAIIGTFLFIFLFQTSLAGFSPLYTTATADEICNNGVDDDGDGLVDNTDPDCQATACYTASHSYYKVILYPMIQNANGSVTIKVAVQNFRNRALSHVRFELPSGISASAPGSTYQGIRNNYSIENPSTNPYRNINFNVIGEGVKNGKADVLEFTLPAGAPILSTIRVEIKMGSSKYSTSLSTNNCTPANCTNVTNAGQINLVSFNCSSVNIQNQVAATGGSGTLEYRWQQRTFSGSSWSDWTTIANANGSAFSSGAILQLTELRRQSRRATCQDWLNSNTVQISFTEICDNGIDDDCDGLIDCYDPDCSQTTRYSTNVPITISTSSSGTYTSILPITANGIIRKVSVVGLDIAHTYINDLIIKLKSPSGTEVTLLNRICSSQDNIYVTFDQDASSSSLPCPPTSGAAYRPYQSLSAFVGGNASGNWTLTISDLASNDGGQLKNWGLEIHTECLPPCQNNLLSNPGFESNISSWTVSNGSYSNPNSYVVEGSKIVWIYPNSSGSTVSIQQVVTGITPGQVYHLSFFGGTHNPSYQHRVFMEFLNNSNSVLSSAYVEVDRDVDILSLLQLYSLEAAAPSGATKLRIKGTANGDYLKLDRFCLRNNNPCALFSVAASNDENLCLGGTATITATPSGGLQPFSYNWSNGAGSGASRNVSPTSSTTYTVTATDAAGCTATDQVVISVINCTEICDDGIDNDGDGTIDCADSDCVGSSNQAVSSVTAGSDDAEQTISNGSMSLSETTIDLGAESSAPQIAGFRFTNISIPQKAKIVNAYIEFETTGLSQSGSDFIIKMEDNPNPGTFQNSTGNLSGRLKLVNSITWENAGSWSVANKRKKTSNLASLVQEMIDNPSWQSGNAMAFFIEGSGTRGLKSFEAGKAPVLVITFDQAPNTHSLLKTYALDDSYEAFFSYDPDPNCSSPDWQNFWLKFEAPDGFWMDEYNDGTAVLRGTIQNQLDQCDQWDVYVKLKNKRNWSAWAALGRTYYAAANASCSQNHPQWNYYELDENVSRWSGRIGSCNEGKVTIIKHNPPNKMKGIQVGQGSSNCQGCDCDQVTVRGWYRMCGDLNLPCGDFGSSLGGFDHESPCLILNSDFENGFQYWHKDPDVVLTSDASSGSNAARIFGNDRGLNINDLPGEEGKIYNLTFDAKKAEAISWAGVGIDFYDGSRNRLNKVVTSVESSTYKTYSLGAIAPPGTVFVDIWVWKGTGGQLYVDNFCLSVEDDEGSHLCGLINPGFESPTSTGWTGFGSHTRSNDAVAGNFAFQTPAGGDAGVNQTVDVVGGTNYYLTFWAKVSNINNWAGMTLTWKDAQNNAIAVVSNDGFTDEYQEYNIFSRAPANATKAEINIAEYGSGIFYVDEICFGAYVQNSGDCPYPINAGFENGKAGWIDNNTGALITSNAYNGLGALLLSANQSTAFQNIPVTPDTTYFIKAFAKQANAPSRAELFGIWRDANMQEIFSIVQPVLANEFKLYEFYGKAPANAAFLSVGGYKEGLLNGSALMIDDVCVSSGPAPQYSDFTLHCGNSDNLLGNGSFEFNSNSLSFSELFENSSSQNLNNNDQSSVPPWISFASSESLIYINDELDVVNNPDGSYFIYLPEKDQMLVYDTHFGNDLLLEDGKTYILCFYAASWVDDPNNPVQTPGVVCLELDHLKSGIQTVEAWSAPSSSGWDTLSWTKYNYIFDFDESDPPEAFIIKNCSNNGGGVVIDGVSISQIESPDTVATDACGQGSIRLERWNQISGTSLSNLRTNKNFPNKPDAVTFLSNFQSENNGDDNYGSRVTGYLHPPQTGSYVFTLTGDDQTEFYLSTDDDPLNKIRVAYVSGWTNITEFGKYAQQTSAPINLVAGSKYYVELLHKEGGGGDHFQVYWQTPSNSTRTVIPGQYLSPVCYPEDCTNGLDDDGDGLIDCQDPDCTPLAVSAEVEGGGCAESTSGNVNLIVSGVAPFAYEWTDMEYTARWTFEESTNDVSDFGNHQNGGLGQIIYDRIAVQGNSSAYFNGATYLRYSVDAGGFMEKDFSKVSFSAWINPNELSGTQYIFEEGSSANGIALRLFGNKLQAAIRNNSQQVNARELTFPNDKDWHHVAFVFDAGSFTLYLDGAGDTTVQAPFTTIGNHSGNGGLGYLDNGSGFGGGSGEFFTGRMDDVRYHFEMALTASQVADLARNDGDRLDLPFGLYSVLVESASGCLQLQNIALEAVENLTEPGEISGEEVGCAGYDPGPIVSLVQPSLPDGGTLEIQWELSADDGANWEAIDGAVTLHYNPSVITQTYWYRRGARALGCNVWYYSNIVIKSVVVNVDDPGVIGGDEINCLAFDPGVIINVAPPAGGFGAEIQYSWERSTDGGNNWEEIINGVAKTFDPGTVTQTTLFRRKARRFECQDWYYSNIVTKTIVFNFTAGGNIAGDQSVCGAYNPALITSISEPSGGVEGTLQYQWFESTNGGVDWTEIAGAVSVTYDPPQISQTKMYKRGARRSPCANWVFTNFVTKIVRPIPAAQITEFPTGPNGFLCENESYIFQAADAGAGAEYVWDFGANPIPAVFYGKGPHNVIFYVADNAVFSTQISLNVTLGGCSAEQTMNYTVRPVIEVTNVAVTHPAMCGAANGSIVISANYPAGTSIQISLDDGATWGALNDLSFEDLPAGTYEISARYSTGDCQIEYGSVTLSDPIQPNADIIEEYTQSCLGDVFTFTAENTTADATYQWYFGEGASPSSGYGIGPFNVTYNTAGIKSVSLLVSKNGCTNSANEDFELVSNFSNGGNIIGDELVCDNRPGGTILHSASPSGGVGSNILEYRWEKRTETSPDVWTSWSELPNSNTSNFVPGSISVNTAFRRKARRTSCTTWAYSNEIVKTKGVSPQINNVVFDEVCPGLPFFNNLLDNHDLQNFYNISILDHPTNGSLDLEQNGDFIYFPNSTFCGQDSFTYFVCNYAGNVCCDTAGIRVDMRDMIPPQIHNTPDDIQLFCDEQIPLPPFVLANENCLSIDLGIDEVTTQGVNNCSLFDYIMTRTWTAVDYCGNSVSETQLITVKDNTAPDIFRVYQLPNNKKLVAGVMENVRQRWKTIRFPFDFQAPPIVFTQLITDNDTAAVVTRIRNVSKSQFEMMVQEEENSDAIHGLEKVAWIAVESGVNGGSENPFQIGSLQAGHVTQNINFGSTFNTTPRIIVSANSSFDTDPVYPRFHNLSQASSGVYLQEETSKSADTTHTLEKLGYWAWTSPLIYTKTGEIFGESGTLTIDTTWQSVPFQYDYHNPVIIASGLSSSDKKPGFVKIRNLKPDNFEIKLETWDYLNGGHGEEQVHYIVVEGSIPFDAEVDCHDIPSALRVGIDLIAVDNCDNAIGIQYNEITNQNNCYPNNQILRSWSVKDECGNTFAVSQVLTVIDTTPPTFTVPPTKVVKYYDDFDNLAALGDVTDEADNCTESLEAFYYDILPEEIDYFDTSYLIQRVWQASDECGNITQKTQNIFVQNKGGSLSPKAMLQAALLRGQEGLMRDDLRNLSFLPLVEPYSQLPHFHHVGEGGGERTTQEVFQRTGPDAIVDWVFVEIRDPINPDSVVDTRAGLLQRDGDVVDVDGQSPLRFNNLNFGSYHVAVRHRNHLGLMTKNTIVIDPFYATPVDLANRESLSYGKDASISLMNSRALWGGDLNSDRSSIYQGPKNDIGNLFLDVISDVENFGHLPNYIKRGYETTDFDLDGKAIFQGPDNDRAKLLLEVVLRNPRNILKISNFIVDEVLPKKN